VSLRRVLAAWNDEFELVTTSLPSCHHHKIYDTVSRLLTRETSSPTHGIIIHSPRCLGATATSISTMCFPQSKSNPHIVSVLSGPSASQSEKHHKTVWKYARINFCTLTLLLPKVRGIERFGVPTKREFSLSPFFPEKQREFRSSENYQWTKVCTSELKYVPPLEKKNGTGEKARHPNQVTICGVRWKTTQGKFFQVWTGGVKRRGSDSARLHGRHWSCEALPPPPTSSRALCRTTGEGGGSPDRTPPSYSEHTLKQNHKLVVLLFFFSTVVHALVRWYIL
jgi:hypothetical protein